MRISIIGQPASGKSFLAERISKQFGIQHIHIDRIYFEVRGRGRRPKTEEEKSRIRAHIKEKVEALIVQDSWVSDGWYSRVQPQITERADAVVYLDVPLMKRLCNHLYRATFEDRHEELAKWDEVRFIGDMFKRMFTHRPKMERFARENAAKVIRLKSHKEADQYFEELQKKNK